VGSENAHNRTFKLVIKASDNGHSLSAAFLISPSSRGHFGKRNWERILRKGVPRTALSAIDQATGPLLVPFRERRNAAQFQLSQSALAKVDPLQSSHT
jgi:hypothetical protein